MTMVDVDWSVATELIEWLCHGDRQHDGLNIVCVIISLSCNYH